MGMVLGEEVEDFRQETFSGSSPLEKFFSMVEFLKEKGFKGEPKVFTNGPVRLAQAEMSKEEGEEFGKKVLTFILTAEEKGGAGKVEVTGSRKFLLQIPYSGPFTGALASYLSKRMNLLKVRRKDREMDEIFERFRRIDEVVG